ncbi:MAG: hypothetical protein GX592_11675 [Clostridiales bacterium]|nr:hypothetical protein [Clostridiales bacterium]
MSVRRVLAALIAVALLMGGAVAEVKWGVAPVAEAAEAAFDGAYYTAKGRLSAEIEEAYGTIDPFALQSYEFGLSVREAADGFEAELVLDQLGALDGEEPAPSNRLEASLSIGVAGGNGLLTYTSFNSQGNPAHEERYSATLDGDYRLTVRDEVSGEVIFDGVVLEALGASEAAANVAAWGEALPLLEESAMAAFGPLLNKLDDFFFVFSDSALVHMRELALPVAQFLSDPRVESALKALGMPGLPMPRMSLPDLLDVGSGAFKLQRLDDGNVSVTFLSEGSPETSEFKVEAILRPRGLDFKVLNSTYDGAYETVAGGEIDFSDGLHIAFEDYTYGGTFLYLDAFPGEMSDTRQVFDARAAFKLAAYDDPELMFLHLENSVDDEAGTARTDGTLRVIEGESTTTVTLEIDHTFKE